MKEFSCKSGVDKYGRMYMIVSYKEDEKVVEKKVDMETFRTIINGSIKDETKYVLVPSLPQHVYKAFISAEGEMDGFKVLLYYEPQKGPLSYMGKLFRIPFPALLFFLQVGKNGQLKEKKVYALKEMRKENVTDNSELYFYPYSNVYSDGRICMGNILSNFHTITDALSFKDQFIEGRSNGDLYSNRNTLKLKMGELIEKVEKEDRFPVELLEQANLKVRDLFESTN